MDWHYFTFTLLILACFSLLLYNAIVLKTLRDIMSVYHTSEAQTVNCVDTKKQLFHNYIKDFNKRYGSKELHVRFLNFKESLQEIDALNAKEGRPVFGLTKYSDMSKEDLETLMLTKTEFIADTTYKYCEPNKTLIPAFNHSTCHQDFANRPAKFDWRSEGVVSPVLEQKRCHVCYAFSTVGVMESVSAIRNISHDRLSIQELIDCSKSYLYSSGCKGGNIWNVFNFLCDKNYLLGIVTEDQYPLTLTDSTCRVYPPFNFGRKLKEYLICKKINENILPGLIWKYGPALAVVNCRPWLYYEAGIIYRACEDPGSDMSHVIQIVGYDTTGPIPYYIIRNSWGDDFGEDGYLRLKIGENLCGIADQVAFLDVYN